MELHQLRYLIAVADHGSFTAAADSLQISQSGVSAQVAKLERELGHRLLDRESRSVQPTREGIALLPHARAAVEAVDTLRQAAGELSGVITGHVRVGTVIGCTIDAFFAGFTAFRAEHPGVSVELEEGDSSDLVAELVAGRLDVALVAHAEPLPDSVRSRTIIREPLAVVVAEDHQWAGAASVSCADLMEQTVLCLPAGTGARRAFDLICAADHVRIDTAVQAHAPESLMALAERGAGVAVLTGSMAAGRHGTVAVRLARSVRSSLSLATRVTPSAAANAMARTVAEHLLGPAVTPR